MEIGSKIERPKRRTCRDSWRYRRRRIRRIDPAASTALTLLLIILILVGRAPLIPSWWPQRSAALDLPVRDDWSAEQEERERGEGGRSIMPPRFRPPRLHGRYRASPSYRRLVADLRRPAARNEALEVLGRRLALPAAAQGWLDEISDNHDWPVLAACAPPGRVDADAEIALLRSALSWLKARQEDDASSTEELRHADGDSELSPDLRPTDGGDPSKAAPAP